MNEFGASGVVKPPDGSERLVQLSDQVFVTEIDSFSQLNLHADRCGLDKIGRNKRYIFRIADIQTKH